MKDAPPPTNIDFEDASGRLAEAFSPCFSLALQLRGAHEYGPADVLRDRIKALLDDARKTATSLGTPPEDVKDAEFALVAFLDETLVSSDWSLKDHWVAKPLQLELFDRNDAGEEFFVRLDRLRANPARHVELLEVYYLCMALGFKGRYQLHGQEEYRQLIEESQAELARQPGLTPGMLSPHGKPSDQTVAEVQSRLPTWILLVAAVALGLILYVGASFYISDVADDTAREIGRMAGSETGSR